MAFGPCSFDQGFGIRASRPEALEALCAVLEMRELSVGRSGEGPPTLHLSEPANDETPKPPSKGPFQAPALELRGCLRDRERERVLCPQTYPALPHPGSGPRSSPASAYGHKACRDSIAEWSSGGANVSPPRAQPGSLYNALWLSGLRI